MVKIEDGKWRILPPTTSFQTPAGEGLLGQTHNSQPKLNVLTAEKFTRVSETVYEW